VPRGRDFLRAAAPEPYLAKQTVTDRARVDAVIFLVDRAIRSTSYEFPLDAGQDSAFDFHDRIVAGTAAATVFAQSINFYDGPAFIGLPFGQVGPQGVVVRTEQLVLTDQMVATAASPPYLSGGAPPIWTADYPTSFQAQLPAGGGYTHQPGDTTFAPGYFARTASCEYDFQRPPPVVGRGLLLTSRDPVGRDTAITYDSFDFLPVEVVDPLLLSRQATYDYRTLQPSLLTDPNGNRSAFAYVPLGMLESVTRMGKAGESVGDTPDKPSTRYIYDLEAFAQRGQPASVRTIQRVHHALDVGVSSANMDDTQETLEYSDGLGRLLQTRILGEDVRFGDPQLGDSGLPRDDSTASAPPSPTIRSTNDPPFVTVTGWQVFDNKGRVVESYEPFFSEGWDFEPNAAFGGRARTFYDPRGRAVRHLAPDGSERTTIYGVPADLTAPEHATPTPWEAYTYDANDNAGRTHPSVAASYRSHWNTPSSKTFDAWERAVAMVDRNGPSDADQIVTRTTYDVRDNKLVVHDAAGRASVTYAYDLADRSIRVDSIDAGRRTTVYDARGAPVEQRDAKGSLVLRTYDPVGRLLELWARDVPTEAVGLRERTTYGEGAPNAAALNLRGRVLRAQDAAGTVDIDSYDFRGNVLARTRQALADSYFTAAPLTPDVAAARVDWSTATSPPLEPRSYRSDFTYDALNRATAVTAPQDVTGARQVMTRTYNRAGLLQRLELDGIPYVAHAAYNARGQRVLVALGNGILARYAYDPATFRLARSRSEPYTEPAPLTYATAGRLLQDVVYSQDLVGNILGASDLTPGSGVPGRPDRLDRTFQYDAVYRLQHATGRECAAQPPSDPWLDVPRCQDVTATRSYDQFFEYDPVGNLRSLRHVAGPGSFTRLLTPHDDSNRLDNVQVGAIERRYAYDASGNLTAEDTSRAYEWDHANRMRAFREGPSGAAPTLFAQYLYDTAGQRVKKIVRNDAGQVSVTVYIDGLFETRRNFGSGSSEENDALHLSDHLRRVAIRRAGGPLSDDPFPAVPDGVMYHLADHLDSSNVVLDRTGAFLNREEYTPFGETSFGSFAHKRYRFTGKERDEETGLAYHSARYFACWLGRWISPDSTLAAGLNLFEYVKSNPMRYFDPSGHEEEPSGNEPTSNSGEDKTDETIEGIHLVATGLDVGHLTLEAALVGKHTLAEFALHHAGSHLLHLSKGVGAATGIGVFLGFVNIPLGVIQIREGQEKLRSESTFESGVGDMIQGYATSGSGVATILGVAGWGGAALAAPALATFGVSFGLTRIADEHFHLSTHFLDDVLHDKALREEQRRYDDEHTKAFATEEHRAAEERRRAFKALRSHDAPAPPLEIVGLDRLQTEQADLQRYRFEEAAGQICLPLPQDDSPFARTFVPLTYHDVVFRGR
jgi:RHS repeat-associated protein